MCIMYAYGDASQVLSPALRTVSQSVNQRISQLASLLKRVSHQPSFPSLRVSHVARPTAEQQLGIPMRLASLEDIQFL